MSGGIWTPVESPGSVSRPKMCIWRSGGPKSIGKHTAPASAPHDFLGQMYIWPSGGPKSMGKHIAPASAPHYFLGNIAVFDVRLSTAAGPDGLSDSTKYTRDCLSESTKYTQNQWKINIFMV